MSAAATPRLSVIVATLDRARYLRECLDGLLTQTAAADQYEVIVVDNGSTDETPAIVKQYCERAPNFSYLREERTGLSVARNAGVRASRADIVAFTDDDAVPELSWVERIVARFESLGSEVAVLGGEVRPIWGAPRPEWLSDELLRPLSAGLLWSPTARVLRGDEWLVEVNIAYRKAVLLEFGGFAEQLGRVGDTLMSGEGCINLLLIRAGRQLFYDPEIVVGHHIPASRLTRGWFRRRFFWQGVSMNRVAQYVEQVSAAMKLPDPQYARRWEEIEVPSSAAAWADLFEDRTETPFVKQVFHLEQLGYLLQSQSLIVGR
jgi:glycosyltransferase involved in cell wall biosynthesis